MQRVQLFSPQLLPKTQLLGIIVCLFLAVLLAYFPALNNDFVNWDDDVHLLTNQNVQSLDGEHIKAIFTQTVNKTYIPLTTLFFAVENHFFGKEPAIYHWNNLLLHFFVTVLVFLFAYRLGISLLTAVFAALIFAVHPMHVEAVAWVTARKDVLYSFFYLLAMHQYLSYLQSSRRMNYILSLLCGVLSALAKPMAVSLPLILWLCDWYCGRRWSRSVLVDKIAFFALIVPVVWATYFLYARNPVSDIGQGILIWAWCFSFYIWKFILPFKLSLFYWLPKPVSFSNHAYWPALALVILFFLSLYQFRRNRLAVFAMLYFVFSIFFLLRFDVAADANLVSDRFMYLPSLGFCIFLAVLCREGVQKIASIPLRRFYIVLISLLTSLLLLKTQFQSLVWRDGVSLWSHQLRSEPLAVRALSLNKLGNALMQTREYKKAVLKTRKESEQPRQRAEDDNTDGFSSKDTEIIGRVLALQQGALAIKPDFAGAYYSIAMVFADLGIQDNAMDYFELTLRYDPDHFIAHYFLGRLNQGNGQAQKAVEHYQRAIELSPGNTQIMADVRDALGAALSQGDHPEYYRQEMIRIDNLFRKNTD